MIYIASLIVALGLAGCATMAPKYRRPPLPVPGSYGQSSGSTVSTTPQDVSAGETPSDAAQIAWRDYFTDPVLQSLIERALANSRDLRRAVLRVQEARARYRIQRADELPTIGVGVVGAKGRVPGNVLTPDISPDFIAVGGGNATWEIDFWGRVRSLKNAALESYLSSQAASRATGLTLIEQVADSYVGIRELDERLALAHRAVTNRDESLRVFTRRVQVGASAKFDLTQVEVLRQQAVSLATELELSRDTEAHALDLLVGAPANVVPVSTQLDARAMFVGLEPGLPSELLTQRPDILAAEHALKASNADIGAARAAFFPHISLTDFIGLASPALKNLFDGDSFAWIVIPSALETVFDRGRRHAVLDAVKIRRDEEIANYEHTIQAAFRDVVDALSARTWLANQVEALRVMVASQAERVRLAKLSYDRGKVRYLEVLDAERELLENEQQLARARGALLKAHVDLYAALGGGATQFVPPQPPRTTH
jgi:multidrug efflux system outer membrane protein